MVDVFSIFSADNDSGSSRGVAGFFWLRGSTFLK